jgi:hypothetical protein
MELHQGRKSSTATRVYQRALAGWRLIGVVICSSDMRRVDVHIKVRPRMRNAFLLRRHLVVCLAALSTLSASCGGGSDDRAEQMYKASGSLQCATSLTTRVRLDGEVSALRSAGAVVLTSSCASDGEVHPVACGTSSGELFSVEVEASSVSVARSQGFTPSSMYPRAFVIACR